MQTQNNKNQPASSSAYLPAPWYKEVFAQTGGASAFSTAPGDWQAMRKAGNMAMEALAGQYPDVLTKIFATVAEDGAELDPHYFYKDGTQSVSAIVYAHGGAMIMGNVSLFHSLYPTAVQRHRRIVPGGGIPQGA